jgi:hypothetical protein
MSENTISISKDEVNEYIQQARDSTAEQGLERIALMYAENLTYVAGDEPLTDGDYIPQRFLPNETWGSSERPMRSLTDRISDEIAEAFCKQSVRYKHAVAEVASSSKLLIAAIAGYVASHVGIAIAVIAALVASLLRIVSLIGVSVFCKQWKASKHSNQ